MQFLIFFIAFSIKIIILIIILIIIIFLGPRRKPRIRGGARGVVKLGGLTHWKQVCVCVPSLQRHTHSNIRRLPWWFLFRVFWGFFYSLEGSLDVVIWSFKHSAWKKLCIWAKSFRRFFWRVTASPPLDEALRCPLILYPFWARISTLTPPILYTLKVIFYQVYLLLCATLFCFVLWWWKWSILRFALAGVSLFSAVSLQS